MQKITTFLWFNNNAEEAARFYTSVFPNSKITSASRYPDNAPMPAGTALVVSFELSGQEFMALNGGPQFTFTEAISLMVRCETQAEIDELWSKLSAGGQEGPCGWLKDQFGLSWQIVPTILERLMADKDREKANRTFKALMQMKKLDIAELQRAHG